MSAQLKKLHASETHELRAELEHEQAALAAAAAAREATAVELAALAEHVADLEAQLACHAQQAGVLEEHAVRAEGLQQRLERAEHELGESAALVQELQVRTGAGIEVVAVGWWRQQALLFQTKLGCGLPMCTRDPH